MGWSAARKLRQLLGNVTRILAVEAACAAQALDFRTPLKPGPATGAVLARIRQDMPFIDRDTFMAPQLKTAEEMVSTGALMHAAEEALGSLQ